MSDRIDVSARVTVKDESSGEIGRIRGALQGLQDMARSVGQSFARMGTMKGLGAAAKGVGSAFTRLGGQIMSIVRPVAAMIGITGGIGIAEAIGGLQSYIDTAKGLPQLAKMFGTTVEGLSGLQQAASRVGIGTEELNSALRGMQRNLGQASIGKLPALTSLMQKYGINTLDPVTKKQRDMNDILGDFAGVVAKQKDPLIAARMSAAIFGRAMGPEMQKLLEKGKDGIAAYVEEARKMGLVITAQDAQEAKDFAAAQGEINRIWQSLGRELNKILMPAIKPLLLAFRDFLNENRDDIVGFFRSIGAALSGINWKATFDDIREWGRWIGENIKYIGGWKGALVAFGLVLAGPLLASIALLTLALGKLALAILLNPIALAVTAIAVAAFLIWKNWDKIGEHFAEMWSGIKARFFEARDWLASWLPDFSDERIKAAWESLGTWFATKWAEVRAPFIEWGTWLAGFLPDLSDERLRELWAGISEWFSTKWAEIKTPFIAAGTWLAGWIPQFVWDGIRAAWSGITGFFDTLWQGVTKAFQTAWGLIEPIITAIKNAISWITGNLPSLESIGGSAVFNAPRRAVEAVGGPVVRGLQSFADWTGLRDTSGGAASVPQQAQSVAQQAASVQQPARVEGQVGVDIHMTGAPPGTTISTQERGQVRATGDVGQTMAMPA